MLGTTEAPPLVVFTATSTNPIGVYIHALIRLSLSDSAANVITTFGKA